MVAAVAIAATGPVAAHAAAAIGVSPAGTYTYSSEGLALTGAVAVALPDVRITLGNNLAQNDDIFITLPSITPAIAGAGLVVCDAAGSAIGYIDTVKDGWHFRVTAVGGVVLGEQCTFSGLHAVAASLSGSPGVLYYRARRFITEQLLDQAESASSIVVRSQFGLSLHWPLNGIVDVYSDRLAFAAAESQPPGSAVADPKLADTLNYTVTRDGFGTTFTGPTVTTTRTTLEIDGDFQWVDSADPGPECTPGEFPTRIPKLGAWYVVGPTSNCRHLELYNTDASGTDEVQGYFLAPGWTILNPTDYTGRVRWDYHLVSDESAASTRSEDWDPGEWTINGTQVYVPYLPYGEGMRRMVHAANRGVHEARARADLYYGGETSRCFLGTLPAAAVTDLSAAIDQCVQDIFHAVAGKVSVRITFTARDRDIEVHSAYTVDGKDLGTVVNSSNGRAF